MWEDSTVWILIGGVGFWVFDILGLLPTHREEGTRLAFEVDFPEVYRLWREGRALFVDARPASLLMQRLLGQGYRNVRVFPRGVQGWQALGYPLERGNDESGFHPE